VLVYLEMSDFLTVNQKVDLARRDFIKVTSDANVTGNDTNNSVSWDQCGMYKTS
jgi:hypothetical protein